MSLLSWALPLAMVLLVIAMLLTLVRLEPSAQRLGLTDLDLLPLCRETLAELTPLALAPSMRTWANLCFLS